MSTPALPQAGHSTSDDHMAISRRFAAHAMDELSRGNRLQASEKVWGAAAHALKAVGIQRGWHHRTHLIVKDIGFHLARELGRPDLRNHVIKADSMHQNFYENEADDDIILDAIIDVGEFVDKLAEVSASPPMPFTVETGADQRRLGRFLGLPAEELPELGTRSPTGFSRAAPGEYTQPQ